VRLRAFCVILFTVFVQTVMAQNDANLTGRVEDQTGAIVVGATVTATNVDTGVPHSAKTTAAGVYAIPFLPPGPYELKVEAAGFKTALRSGVVLQISQALEINMKLTAGSASQVVNDTGSANALDTSMDQGQTVGKQSVDNVPVESRRALSLTKLDSGVAFKAETGIEDTPSFSVAGGRSQDQGWHLDGGSAQDNALGGPTNQLNPPSESLQEFRTETNSYSAEYGRSAGGHIVMTTKSGTNAFHGSAYEYVRNDAFDTRTFFAQTPPPLRYNTFGAAAGGRVIKNKLFYFINWESARKRNGSTFANNTVPTLAEVGGNFSGIKGLTIKDPLTGTAFPGNIIPASRLDPIGKQIAAFYPAPNINTGTGLADSNDYVNNVSDAVRQDTVTTKFDYNLSDKNKFYLRYTNSDVQNRIAPVFTANPFADFRAERHDTQQYNGVADWVHTFSPDLINNFSFTYVNHAAVTVFSQIDSGENAKIGLTGPINPDDYPYITVAGYSSQGAAKQFRDRGPSLTLKPSDSATWTKGRHEIKFGGEYTFSFNCDRYQQQPGGEFDFTTTGTGSGMASLLLGWVNTADVITAPELLGRIDAFGAYVQDKWTVSDRLTVNLGVRYEVEGPRWDRGGSQSGFNPTAINPVSNTPGVITFDGVNGVSKYANNWDLNNFGPRVGFAYRIADRWALRGGFGMFYDSEYGTVSTSRILTTGFGINASFNSPNSGTTPAFLLYQGMPAAAPITETAGYGAVPVGGKPTTSPDFVSPNHPTSYSLQWNFGIQHELRHGIVVEASYVANVSHKIAGNQIDINQIPLVDGHGPAVQSQTLRPFPQFSHVYEEADPFGNSSYHSLNAKLEKKFSKGLLFMANYTWSKFLDNITGGDDMNGTTTTYQSIYLQHLDKSYSGSDIPQSLAAHLVYELPFGKGRHFSGMSKLAENVVGGWSVTTAISLHSGLPWGVTELTNTSNTYSSALRANITCNPAISNFTSKAAMLSEDFNTSCFQAPPASYFGDSARNVGFGPGWEQIDGTLEKQWRFKERFNLQLRVDNYNITNRANFANPNSSQGSGSFGTIAALAAGAVPREFQFGLKLKF
jgi:hypothetical protein